jgi:valyl-tRNA synthetase
MSGELPKTYDPAAVEAETDRVWLEEKCFAADPANPGDPYCIVIPPPNVTGALHLGHAINNTLQDILIRVHRMRGFNTLWIAGIDHAGIATQAVVEKQLKEKENKTRYDVGRDQLVRRIWEWKEQYGNRILEQLKRMGCSCDWDRTRFTLDEMCARAVRETFFKLFKDGLIYRGKRLVNWDIHLQTSISDDEIYHETVKTSLWHVKYPINGSDKFLTVATTRPETMLGDTAVAVHSQDPRWNWAIGKSVKLPLTDRLIPIIADDILVDPKFGTGVVKVTPAHDPNDYAVWQRHQGKPDEIAIINILNPNGTLNENGGPFANMKRDAARKKVVEDLTAQGLLEKEEPYETQVGHSDRSKTPVEPYLSDQWFVKMAPLAEPALEVVRNGTIKFFPERHAQQYLAWLGEKRDWPISRQLWWGHRIPVWTRKDWNHRAADSEWKAFGRQLSKWSGEGRLSMRVSHADAIHFGLGPGIIDPGANDFYLCVRDPGDREVIQKIEAHGFTQDPDVLDTWFSSALWPHSTLGWPDQTPELKKWYPTSVLLTGRDIITLWVARMVMTGLYNMKAIPFHHVAINPTILDGKGERMSKSKGNGVDPVDIIDTHGADALRFTLAMMATETQDVRMPVVKDSHGRNTSEKFDIGRSFAIKLWNAARFVLANLENTQPVPVDQTKWPKFAHWIVDSFNLAVKEANTALENYRFDQFAKVCYDFFWRDFCDWYVESFKMLAKNPESDPEKITQSRNVLAAVLDGTLRLLHPVIPFITEKIWWKLNEIRPARGLPTIPCPPSSRLIKASWPTLPERIDAKHDEVLTVQRFVAAIRNLRNQYKIDPRTSLTVSIIASAPTSALVHGNQLEIEQFANCKMNFINSPILGAARITVDGCDLFVEGVADEGVDQERVGKLKEELTQKRATLKARLENPGYIAKAPPHLVEQTKKQLADAEAELAKLGTLPE